MAWSYRAIYMHTVTPTPHWVYVPFAPFALLNTYLYFQPPIYAAYLYDAVYQFGVALNKSITKLGPEAQNRTPTGEEILSHLFDYSFESMCFFVILCT